MKDIFLTKEQSDKVLKRMKEEALARGGILSTDLAKMINKDVQQIREKAEERLKNLQLQLTSEERETKLKELELAVYKEMFP